ncbi:MAG: DUF3576 domain-containing protein [Rhodobacterales bacterium]
MNTKPEWANMRQHIFKVVTCGVLLFSIAACANQTDEGADDSPRIFDAGRDANAFNTGRSIFDVFNRRQPDVSVEVNRYIWNASLDVLNFMPIESVDPFTGVIVFGYGTPPGGGQAYRGTVHVRDPALEARSLTVALQTRSGPVAAGTQRAVEDAILSRARQLRIADGRR